MRLYHLPRLLVWVLSFTCTSFLFAQDPMVVTYDANIQQLSIGDIDFGNFGSSNFLFSININVSGVEQVRLKGTLDIQLYDGSSYPDAARLCTEKFTQPRTLSNLDIGKNASIKTESFEFSQQAKDELQNKALAIGRLPSGIYTFTLELWDAGLNCATTTTMYDREVIELKLQTISRLDLVFPPDGMELTTTFPLFQWLYDGRDVELSVYERLPQHASREEAASGVPHLVVSTSNGELPQGATTYQYPTSGARPLEQGKTYIWKVKGSAQGSGGVGSEINSEIWQFSLSAGANGPSNPSQNQNVSNLLQLLNGLSQEMLTQLLNGELQLTGVILLEGRQLSPAEVIALLQDLAANPDRIINITIVQL